MDRNGGQKAIGYYASDRMPFAYSSPVWLSVEETHGLASLIRATSRPTALEGRAASVVS